MRTLLAAAALSLVALFAFHGAGRAALDASPAAPATVELLVFEHPDCVYCRAFRRDVLPKYRESTSASHVALRFIDIAQTDTSGLALNRRIDTVPTAVLMKDGVEVDRIVGYWAPETFFKLLAHIMARAQ